MKRWWQFFAKPANLAVLLTLGGGLAYLWDRVVEPHFFAKPAKAEHVDAAPVPQQPAGVSQNVVADNGIATAALDNAHVSITIGK